MYSAKSEVNGDEFNIVLLFSQLLFQKCHILPQKIKKNRMILNNFIHAYVYFIYCLDIIVCFIQCLILCNFIFHKK